MTPTPEEIAREIMKTAGPLIDQSGSLPAIERGIVRALTAQGDEIAALRQRVEALQRERDEARRANGVILDQLADEAGTSYGRKTRIDELESALSAAQAEMRERAALVADAMNSNVTAAKIRALPLTPASERAEPWRSMDSAPKDGSELLVTNGTIIIVAFYDNRPAYARQPWAFVGGDHFPANWPTRWMPLPPLPASERDFGEPDADGINRKAIIAAIKRYTAKHTVSREAARAALLAEGLITPDGKLHPDYGGPASERDGGAA